MNITLITLIGITIIGITKLLTYLLGDKRKLRQLENRKNEILEEMRDAAKDNDTARISTLERELKLVREDIARITGKRDKAGN